MILLEVFGKSILIQTIGRIILGLKRPPKKKTKIVFQDRLLLNASQKYYRMLIGEHSAILSTFIMLPYVIKFCLFLSGRLRQVLL